MKQLIFVIILVVAYLISLQLQSKKLELLNSTKHPSIYSSWEKDGTPVYATKVILDTFSKQLTVTAKKQDNYRLVTEVTQRTADRLTRGDMATINNGAKSLTGRVEYISEKTTLLSGLKKVNIIFRQKLPDSQFHIVKIEILKLKDQKIIPFSAISLREKKPIVFVIDKQQKLLKKRITILDKNNMQYLVGDEISVNDQVVISDLRNLQEGQKISVVQEGGDHQ